MDKRKLMLLVGAGVLAIVSALAARSMFSSAAVPQVQAIVAPVAPKGPKIMVAQRALPIGTIITAEALQFQPWPKDLVKDAYFLEGESDMNKLVGTVVRNPITAGQPITQGSLVSPGDRGFLAAALSPGMRAITITVSKNTSVAGFIFPGDHVDVTLMQTVTGGTGSGMKVAETFIRNLRVLATDQSAETETVGGKSVVKNYTTVTLEVTPRIAEKIAVAGMIGTLNLTLRSIADNQTDLEKAIANGSVKIPAGASKSEEERILRNAVSRPIEGGRTFVTGDDVSNFQPSRSSVIRTSRRADTMAELSSKQALETLEAAPKPVRSYSGPVINVTRASATTAEQVGVK